MDVFKRGAKPGELQDEVPTKMQGQVISITKALPKALIPFRFRSTLRLRDDEVME